MRIFWPVDGRRRLVELLFTSSGRADGSNPRVGLGLALKEAEAGRSRRTRRQDDACSGYLENRIRHDPSKSWQASARKAAPPAGEVRTGHHTEAR